MQLVYCSAPLFEHGFWYVQVDNHIAELTVRETLDFAARVLGVGHKSGAYFGAFPGPEARLALFCW